MFDVKFKKSLFEEGKTRIKSELIAKSSLLKKKSNEIKGKIKKLYTFMCI